MDALMQAQIDTIRALLVSRQKSVDVIDKDIASLKQIRATALPVAAVALSSQLKVKELRRQRLVQELQAFQAELSRLEAPELPGVERVKSPTVVKK